MELCMVQVIDQNYITYTKLILKEHEQYYKYTASIIIDNREEES